MIANLRKEYLKKICEKILSITSEGIPSNADTSSKISISLARGILEEIGIKLKPKIKGSGQTAGNAFESITKEFIEKSFTYLNHLRTGKYEFFIGKSIHAFEQYEHLALLTEVLKSNKELKATLGDYLIHPDIVIGRYPLSDDEINYKDKVVDGKLNANLTPLRVINSEKLILHASISCKWTIRSDRSQNA